MFTFLIYSVKQKFVIAIKFRLNLKKLQLTTCCLVQGSTKYRLITLPVVWPVVRRWRDHAQRPLKTNHWPAVCRPASRCGAETWPDLRLKWPQVDLRRLDHIRLDFTWQWHVTWVDFKRLQKLRSYDERAWYTIFSPRLTRIYDDGMHFIHCHAFQSCRLQAFKSE